MIENFLEDLAPLTVRINSTLKKILSEDISFFGQLGLYNFLGGGKRIRPLLFCLIYEALDRDVDENVLLMASAFELLHMATLLHDDIVDQANLRRGHPSAHQVYGIPETVLAGDYFLAKSAKLALINRNILTVDVLLNVIRELSLGELEQLKAYRKVTLSQREYFQIIYRKTAVLIEAVAKIAALEAGLDQEKQEIFLNYGRATGLAFQIMDDVLDYQSESKELGKPTGQDLDEGRITLPFIISCENLNSADKKRLMDLGSLESLNVSEKKEVSGLVHLGQGLTGSQEKAEELAKEASDCLSILPPSKARDRLSALAFYAARRLR
jgi:octaprenyl-diphosphate synthase